MAIRIQTEDFDLSAAVAGLRGADSGIGAVVSFVGTVRDMNEGAGVVQLELEHYPGMTEKALEEIVAQAKARWPVADALVIHRVGPLTPLEQIVLVAVGAAHRGEAFAACEYIIDHLKTVAPFWKKEASDEGVRWVDARDTDEQALAKWTRASGEEGEEAI